MGSARYTTQGKWDPIRTTDVHNFEGKRIAVVITEVADLLDTRSGRVYIQGAHRVRIRCSLPTKPRGKTFKGESAWSGAERYHDDIVNTINRHLTHEGSN